MIIWIINHNAQPPSMGGLSRHHYFAKYLIQAGYTVKIFTSSNIHNSGINMISGKEAYREKDCDGVTYTFVRTGDYTGNGFDRIKNMLEFPFRLWSVCKTFIRTDGKPDIIYTSSPDIFACFCAMLIAKKLKIQCIFEVRDLWPLSIVVYGLKNEKSLLIRVMFKLEKWMYIHADKLIFTMEGGKDYLVEKGLDKTVQKVFHIGNGVDIAEFDYNVETFSISDPDLDEEGIFKAVYTGSMRHVNNIEVLVEAAGILQSRGRKFRLVLFGDGDRVEHIRALIEEKHLHNIVLRKRVEKKFIPHILTKADLCILHCRQSNLMRYGHSNNKMFDYLAAGKPIFSDLNVAYDVIKNYECGQTINSQTPESIADGIEKMMDTPEATYKAYGENARIAAKQYDYKLLAQKLIQVIKG